MTTQSEALGAWINAQVNARDDYNAIPTHAIVRQAMQSRILAGTLMKVEEGELWIHLSFYDGSKLVLCDNS